MMLHTFLNKFMSGVVRLQREALSYVAFVVEVATTLYPRTAEDRRRSNTSTCTDRKVLKHAVSMNCGKDRRRSNTSTCTDHSVLSHAVS